MASPILVQAQPGRVGITVDIYPVDTDVAIITDFAVSETNIGSGYYTGNYLGSETGVYRILVKQDSRTLANWYIFLKNRSGIRDISGDTDPEFFNIESGSYDPAVHNLANHYELTHNNFTKLSGLVVLEEMAVEVVVSQTVFVNTVVVPFNVQAIIGSYAVIAENDDSHEVSVRKITDYDGAGTFTIESAPEFTLTTNDTFVVVLNKPMTTEFDVVKAQIDSKIPIDNTIGTVDNITNPVEHEMTQEIPAVPINGEVSASYANSDRLSFKGATQNLNVSVQDFEDTEWKRVNEEIALAEGYSSVGSIGTTSQILNLILAILQNPQYVNFEFRARRLDGTTEAAAYQMDDDTNPTSHNRIR